MENCKEVHEHDVNVDSQVIRFEKEPVQSEESDNVDFDDSVAAAVALDHLEEDEDFEDVVDEVMLDSSTSADEHIIVNRCHGIPPEHEINSLHPPWNNFQDATDEILHADTEAGARVTTSGSTEGISDTRHSSLCANEKVTSEQQEAVSDTVIVDEEVLREREACMSDEQKQVLVIFCHC